MEIEEKYFTRSCQHNPFTLAWKTYVNSTTTVRFNIKFWKHSVSLSEWQNAKYWFVRYGAVTSSCFFPWPAQLIGLNTWKDFFITFLLSSMFTKTAKVTQARVFAKRKIITYFHFSVELERNRWKKLSLHLSF